MLGAPHLEGLGSPKGGRGGGARDGARMSYRETTASGSRGSGLDCSSLQETTMCHEMWWGAWVQLSPHPRPWGLADNMEGFGLKTDTLETRASPTKCCCRGRRPWGGAGRQDSDAPQPPTRGSAPPGPLQRHTRISSFDTSPFGPLVHISNSVSNTCCSLD